MKKLNLTLLLLITACGIAFSQQSKTSNHYTPELLWKLGRVSDIQVSPDKKTILYGVSWYNLAENKGNRDLYSLPVSGGNSLKVTTFKGSEVNGVFRPDGKKIAFLSAESGSMQIWEANPDGSAPTRISNTDGDITGFSYSPDMKYLLYTQRVKLDKTANDIYPDLPKANAYIENDLMYRHWDSWSDFSYSHIFVASYSDGKMDSGKDIMEKQRFESPMAPWGGMEQITWSPQSDKIAYTCKKLTGIAYTLSTNSEIYVYDLKSGQEINASNGIAGYDQDPVFSPDGRMLVWRSMARAGFEADKDRIMIYDFNTGKYTDYSEKFDQGSNNFTWSADSKTLYFLSAFHGTIQIYSLAIASKEIKQITSGPWDYLSIALAGKDIITSKQSMTMPTEIFKIDASGKETQLSFTNKEILKDIKSAKVEERWMTTTDNKKMLVWVIYPPDFDPTKKYPTLLYCEGGPQSMVSQFFSYRWNFQIMAANDYIVVAPNRRGLPGFGQEWNDQISGDYGGQNMKDYFTAIDEMAKEPYVNKDRLGAVGASYGGFSVLWLAGHHEKRFKVFISHCGMFNLEDEYLTTDEMWFVNWDLGGPYWEKGNPKVDRSYANSPHKFVDKWDTPIMIIEGEHDFRIPYTQGMAAYAAAKLRGIPARYLDFPEESHWVLKPQNSVLWQREFFSWLDEYLKK
ncbi:MAG: S9 family peptidase [Lentimicrobiaceae bacterium]|jgi:dipeptidyl aminopeptidase/acylaminoacyl peptidase